MTDARIPLLSLEDARRAAREAEVPEALAELNIFRLLLHHPGFATQVSGMLMTLLLRGKLDARLRELVIMRIGWATGSVYEWTQHWRVATQLGVDEAELLALRDWRAYPDWSELDRAVLSATDETLEAGAVSAETWALCGSLLPGVEEQIELLGASGTWRFVSQLLRTLEVPLEEGVAPWPPDGLPGGR